MAPTEAFRHSTPELYDRLMGPLLFEPWAMLVAQRAASLDPGFVLETAAGTGILTKELSRRLPRAKLVATDLNPAMLDFASGGDAVENVEFATANAQQLPFADESFDLVVCQFGAMFFPDKVQAGREARRVLRPGGHYMILAFDRLDRNPIPSAASKAVASVFAEDPKYMERGPFSYSDPDLIRSDLQSAGFSVIEIETLASSSRVNASEAAQGIVLGSPFRAEIERLGPSALQQAMDSVEAALADWDGKEAPMSAHLATAAK